MLFIYLAAGGDFSINTSSALIQKSQLSNRYKKIIIIIINKLLARSSSRIKAMDKHEKQANAFKGYKRQNILSVFLFVLKVIDNRDVFANLSKKLIN